ncbi:MAG: UDP-N-acetylmuramoyl-L-alanyl-D-glutamate--2,6-diaminopimelate ligase [Elusimicrobia bacterium GWB2_63_22]|nr:MAG: UDP-N-acetylmuramoyl-L-alanyl-D-glutamate--2,6-diaminopimelate ligase [Elusimicrobia bacterium GWB2_63_22]
MKLSKVLEGSGTAVEGRDPVVSSVLNDSRLAGPGSLFFALPGARTDGSLFIRQALERGAAAVITAAPVPPETASAFPHAAFLTAPDLNRALSKAAANFHGHPSSRLKVYGITGTKGKTTTAYLLENILLGQGLSPGVIGTIDYRVGGKVIAAAANTTPLAHTLQELLAGMAAAGASSVVMEVSSHALALGRVEDVDFDCAVFTNLQRDHLDFHKDRESYFLAKARLFDLLERSPKKDKYAVINADDERAPWLLKKLAGRVRTVTFGIENEADFRAADVEILADMTRFTLKTPAGEIPVRLNLLGRHNVYNALAAIAAAAGGGVDARAAAGGAGALANVPGRLQRVDAGQDFTVFVDYAHTDASLENVLSGLGLMPHRRIITVFGCGGDRDRTKRAPMGAVACALSDLAIVTSDNPRSEDPMAIIDDIEKGIVDKFTNFEIIPDRRHAIEAAVAQAAKGDIVLIAGKGHETYQILKDSTIHFSDAETAAAAIRKKTS